MRKNNIKLTKTEDQHEQWAQNRNYMAKRSEREDESRHGWQEQAQDNPQAADEEENKLTSKKDAK